MQSLKFGMICITPSPKSTLDWRTLINSSFTWTISKSIYIFIIRISFHTSLVSLPTTIEQWIVMLVKPSHSWTWRDIRQLANSLAPESRWEHTITVRLESILHDPPYSSGSLTGAECSAIMLHYGIPYDPNYTFAQCQQELSKYFGIKIWPPHLPIRFLIKPMSSVW